MWLFCKRGFCRFVVQRKKDEAQVCFCLVACYWLHKYGRTLLLRVSRICRGTNFSVYLTVKSRCKHEVHCLKCMSILGGLGNDDSHIQVLVPSSSAIYLSLQATARLATSLHLVRGTEQIDDR